jgi:hypothetical protein
VLTKLIIWLKDLVTILYRAFNFGQYSHSWQTFHHLTHSATWKWCITTLKRNHYGLTIEYFAVKRIVLIHVLWLNENYQTMYHQEKFNCSSQLYVFTFICYCIGSNHRRFYHLWIYSPEKLQEKETTYHFVRNGNLDVLCILISDFNYCC